MQDYFTPLPRPNGRGKRTRSVADRFWEKVDKSGECWIWTGSLCCGYGQMGVGSILDGSRTVIQAHRVSWVIHFGPIPDGLNVCHNCPGGDNRACVNPAHLFLGTDYDNMHDAALKGRVVHRLTPELVLEMRALYAAGGISYEGLGQRFGVTAANAWRAVTGRSWRHV